MWDNDKWNKWNKKFSMYGAGGDFQCPLWKPFKVEYCEKHRIWYINGDMVCPYCLEESFTNKEITWQEANKDE